MFYPEQHLAKFLKRPFFFFSSRDSSAGGSADTPWDRHNLAWIALASPILQGGGGQNFATTFRLFSYYYLLL